MTTNDTTPDSNIEIDANTAAGDTEAAEQYRIVRIGTCPSLSGRSELTYHVGCDKETNAIHFRLWRNTGAGMFSSTWFSLKDVSELLCMPDGISSTVLQAMWTSTSKNNAGFTLAVLQGVGLIEKSLTKPNSYCTVDPAQFLARINTLIASDIDLSEDDEPSDELAIAAAAATKRGRPKKQAT
ncbi:MAG: hypothetical protein IPG23_11370 [Burkholderiales bacterium]|nr:hypothetical protein [Burkholderiales bacterium]